MIETVILEYLNNELDVPVLMELPDVPSDDFPQWPDQFVVMEKVGGGKSNQVNMVSIAFQSYSMSRLYDAAALDERVRDVVEGIIDLDEIGGVHLSSNYNFTDTRAKRYRYQCVYDIYYV